MISVNRELVMSNPELIPEIKLEARRTLELIGYCERLQQLRTLEDWGRFDWALMCTWANKVDEPFVKLMISLAKHGYHYNAISMHKWWHRMKAVNQQHLIAFFTYNNFISPKIKERLFWTDVYEQCCRTADIFSQMSEIYRSDNAVEMNLRALLGCSQKTDIKQAWSEWAKRNHPDKGGNVEKFILVKAAYEEWQNANM